MKAINRAKYQLDDIIAEDPTSIALKKEIVRIAGKDTTVVLLGESGTGKELYAQALHNASGRKDNSFIAVNCATFQKELLESEEIMLEKKSKSGYKTVDLKKSIKNYSLSEKCDFAELEIVLSAGSTDNANPNLIIKALENTVGEEFYADITREDLYNSDMELFR